MENDLKEIKIMQPLTIKYKTMVVALLWETLSLYFLQHCKKFIESLQRCILSMYVVQCCKTRENGDNEKVV
jgi:hypothetical protein